MSDHTQIEWTDSTWNPTTGCTKISRGCDHCYAESLARRLLARTYLAQLPVLASEASQKDPFAVRIWPDRLDIPRAWKEPRRVFVNSMSDLFHNEVPEAFVRRCFEVMVEVPRHSYQILTKRPARAARFVEKNADLFDDAMLPGHIWIGTSVEDQHVAYRIRQLATVPARIRFLSCEPLLGPLALRTAVNGGDLRELIHWVIVGGESGQHARPMCPEWVRAIRDECEIEGVPFFFKQWGGRTPKAGGRALDGRTWDEYPISSEPILT